MTIIRLRHRRVEIRKNPARRLMHFRRGSIAEGAHAWSPACLTARKTESGVRITITIDAKLPGEFFLVLTASGDVRRRCRTLWRDGVELGGGCQTGQTINERASDWIADAKQPRSGRSPQTI